MARFAVFRNDLNRAGLRLFDGKPISSCSRKSDMSIHQSAESGIEVAPFTEDVTTTQRVAPGDSRTGAPVALPNGPSAAAILAAGIGCLALGMFAFVGDAFPAIGHAFNFWNPVGPPASVTSLAVVVWLLAWYRLARIWAARSVNLRRVNRAAFAMLIGGLLLTFMPFVDLLQGK